MDIDEDLREALDLDLMDFLNILIGPSQRSGLKFPAEDAPKRHTPASVVRYIDR